MNQSINMSFICVYIYIYTLTCIYIYIHTYIHTYTMGKFMVGSPTYLQNQKIGVPEAHPRLQFSHPMVPKRCVILILCCYRPWFRGGFLTLGERDFPGIFHVIPYWPIRIFWRDYWDPRLQSPLSSHDSLCQARILVDISKTQVGRECGAKVWMVPPIFGSQMSHMPIDEKNTSVWVSYPECARADVIGCRKN